MVNGLHPTFFEIRSCDKFRLGLLQSMTYLSRKFLGGREGFKFKQKKAATTPGYDGLLKWNNGWIYCTPCIIFNNFLLKKNKITDEAPAMNTNTMKKS